MKIIGFDSETFFSKKLKYTLKTSIAETYCRHELFDCYIVSASDGKNNWAGHPRDFNWSALEGATLVSHNRYFDKQLLKADCRIAELDALGKSMDWNGGMC